MFTGLIESVGRVTSARRTEGGLRLAVRATSDMGLQVGDSVSVNGVCLTVVTASADIAFEVSSETIRSTNLGLLKINDMVNLERPLKLHARLGGHIVTGHVDGTGTIKDKRSQGEFTFYVFDVSDEILRYIVMKGSVAVDGISLTVTGLDDRSFSVAIIPHTLTATNIGSKGTGDTVNIEVDIMGKYIEKFLLNYFPGLSSRTDNHRLMELLKAGGFTE